MHDVLGLSYRVRSTAQYFVYGSSESYWGQKMPDRKSVSGDMFMLNEGPI